MPSVNVRNSPRSRLSSLCWRRRCSFVFFALMIKNGKLYPLIVTVTVTEKICRVLRLISSLQNTCSCKSTGGFTARAAMLARSWESKFCLSVCLSTCHTRALWQNQTMHCGYFDTTQKGNRSSFLTLTVVGGRRPFPSEIFAENDSPPSKNRQLQQNFAYNVSAVRDGEKSQLWWIWSRPWAFQRAIDGVRTLPLSPPKGWVRKRFKKIQFQSNNVCYKVSLCEDFKRHGCP